MTFKALLQALREGRLKLINTTSNFSHFFQNITKFAYLQTMKNYMRIRMEK